jgi:hypothetical protein
LDASGFAAIDVEAVCNIEGTATNAALNLYTGTQIDTEDGWVLAGTLGGLSGTGQFSPRVTISSGLMRFLRWDVSTLGGAAALTFFMRGMGRSNITGVSIGAPVNAGAPKAILFVDNSGNVGQDAPNFLYDATGKQITNRNDGVGTAQTVGLSHQNQALAANNAQQYSPVAELVGQGWNSAASASQTFKCGLQVRPVQQAGNPSGDLVFWYSTNGGAYTEICSIQANDTATVYEIRGAQPLFGLRNNNGTGWLSQTYDTYLYVANTAYYDIANTAFYPMTDNSITIGKSGARWSQVWSYQHCGVAQTVTSSGAITVNPTAGEIYTLTSNGNITSITVSAGQPAQRMTLLLKQGASGNTWPTTMTNVKLPGGSFAKTTTLNAVDKVDLVCDGSVWWATVSSNVK